MFSHEFVIYCFPRFIFLHAFGSYDNYFLWLQRRLFQSTSLPFLLSFSFSFLSSTFPPFLPVPPSLPSTFVMKVQQFIEKASHNDLRRRLRSGFVMSVEDWPNYHWLILLPLEISTTSYRKVLPSRVSEALNETYKH